MANIDRKGGFRPAKTMLGHPWTALVRKYPAIAGRSGTNNSGDIYIGDVVTLDTGNATPMVTSGDPILGVVVAVGTSSSDTALNTENVAKYYDPDNLAKRYLAFDEAGYVGVVPAPFMLFSVQSGLTDLVQGSDMDIEIETTEARGSRTTGNSFQTGTTSVNADISVVELEERPDNDTALIDARYIVKLNSYLEA